MEESRLVKKKKTSVLLFIAIGVCVIGIIAVIVAIIASGGGTGKLQKKLNTAEKYLSELDYEQAIAAYREAI